MNKKYLIIILILAILATVIFLINGKKQASTKNNEDVKYSKEIEPISKEIALKVLNSQYGNLVVNNKDDIKRVGDEYVVDVHLKLEEDKHEDEHEHGHEDKSSDTEHSSHNQSIGKHKINIFTGELTKPK